MDDIEKIKAIDAELERLDKIRQMNGKNETQVIMLIIMLISICVMGLSVYGLYDLFCSVMGLN